MKRQCLSYNHTAFAGTPEILRNKSLTITYIKCIKITIVTYKTGNILIFHKPVKAVRQIFLENGEMVKIDGFCRFFYEIFFICIKEGTSAPVPRRIHFKESINSLDNTLLFM